MTQEELDGLPDITHTHFGAFFQDHDDGIVTCSRTGNPYIIGWLGGMRVKRIMSILSPHQGE